MRNASIKQAIEEERGGSSMSPLHFNEKTCLFLKLILANDEEQVFLSFC